jgi:transcriptional regulator with XRE-family HTH domain
MGPLMNFEELSQVLRDTRRRAGLTQDELASLAAISRRPVYLAESGREIKLGTLLKILDALGLQLEISPRRTGR